MAFEDAPDFDKYDDADWERQDALDANNLAAFLAEEHDKGEDGLNLDRELDTGPKADDAEDYADLSDDDLPDEEPVSSKQGQGAPELTDDDDLFGEDRDLSPFDEYTGYEGFQPDGIPQQSDIDGGLALPSAEQEEDLRALNFQVETFDPTLPQNVAIMEDLVKEGFKIGTVLDFNRLMPAIEVHLEPKQPLKPPKPVNPTKVSLELAPDQERSFRAPGPATGDKRKRVEEAEAKGLVAIIEESSDEGDSDDGFDYSLPDPNEKIGGYTWAEMEIAVLDIEMYLNGEVPQEQAQEEIQEEPMDEWEREFLGHPAQRKKVTREEKDYFLVQRYPVPNLDNFERMTAHIAKRPIVDLNDPKTLVEQQDKPAPKRQRLSRGYKRIGSGTFAHALSQRFNISNDEAYDALKENHQSKVRATLGTLAVEHSMPALKLQWPYYLVKLHTADARSFHRPSLKFNQFLNQPIVFSKPNLRKRKTLKGLSTQEIFKETKDLSLADIYSHATLFEYSEEHPTVLSNFGMGNRVINYYRRKDAHDAERPQQEDKIGDLHTLLPEDRSPFSNFGMVDPGETVRALSNGMYRAPIFKHEPQATDFLVIRSSTGINGTQWHLRNIDNLFVVGQQFPVTEVPGPHSRKVTNAAKNRMKMISFRKIRKNPKHNVRIQDVTSHIPESTDMQNRQKLKEFLLYHKDEKVWAMKPGEQVPEEAQIRSMITPEDICLLDATQVGQRHLEDAGYAIQDEEDVVDEDGQSLEQNLAPWKTTKAFLDASADKAMLRLHGAGDPSGRGLAFSFIKTSMKGGYLEALVGPDADLTPALEAARAAAMDPKNNNGHGYNVKTQQKLYNDAIRVIWDAQKTDLSNTADRVVDDIRPEASAEVTKSGIAQTPRPDDSASVQSGGMGRVLRIVRRKRNQYGQVEEFVELIKNPKVANQYVRRRRELEAEKRNVYEAQITGDPEVDRLESQRVKKELARLERNRERRHAREKQKGKGNIPRASTNEPENALSPSSIPTQSLEKPTGTTRKCANCGQAGHIKTNKKLCPMLNGTMKQEDLAPNHGGFGAIQAPSFS